VNLRSIKIDGPIQSNTVDAVILRAAGVFSGVESLSMNFETLKKQTTENFMMLFKNLKHLQNLGCNLNVYPHLQNHGIKVASLSSRIPLKGIYPHFYNYLRFASDTLESFELSDIPDRKIEPEFYNQKFIEFTRLRKVSIHNVQDKIFANLFNPRVPVFLNSF
jgi:hypothetical protein